MLVKSEMKKVPLCECPTFSKKELPAANALLVASAVHDLPRCGKIIVVDYYTPSDRKLQGRFFSDGQKYITYCPEADCWDEKAPERNYRPETSAASKATVDMISQFLNVKYYGSDPWYYSALTGYTSIHGPLALCAEFASKKRREESVKRSDAKHERMMRHLHMFPERYPEEVDAFLERKVFPETYIFYTKLDRKHKRTGRCASCGKTFRVPEEIKHGEKTCCPRCGRPATCCAEWLGIQKTDKAVLCYPLKKDGNLLLEFSNVTRKVCRGAKRPNYDIEAFACCLYLNENGKQKIYSYGIGSAYYYYSHDWCSWGNTPVYRDAYVYTGNLREIFGERYYNVNIPEIMERVNRPIDIAALLDNLKRFPQTEYLCKHGMTVFASKLRPASFLDPAARNIKDALGIRKQDVALYVKNGITVAEHEVLMNTKEPLNDGVITLLRSIIDQTKGSYYSLSDLVGRMTVQKLYNYIRKQKELGTGTPTKIVRWMDDFYKMSEEINVTLNKKNMFPSDIKKAHDELSDRITKLRAEIVEQASKNALEVVNNYFDGYGRNGYMIVVPQSRKDFVREGQELSHCVGSQPQYYNDHMAGTKMIFFIRAAKAPTVALYTAQIDMVTHRVIQCYGYGDKPAPAQVKKFVYNFAKWLKNQKPHQTMKDAS